MDIIGPTCGETAYIPSCTECLRNKSSTHKPTGPLHPLPIPDTRGDSVAMDFIGPLPLDENFDCILSMTDQLGSDIRIIPTRLDITAENLAVIFYESPLGAHYFTPFPNDFWFPSHTMLSNCGNFFVYRET